MGGSRTLYDKIWDRHTILVAEGGRTLLHVGRHLVHDGSFHAFGFLEARGLGVRQPERTFATPDHSTSTKKRSLAAIFNAQHRQIVEKLEENATKHKITLFGLKDPRQGIVHVVGPEQGISLPGLVMVCGDSHTSTHGALGALAFGIGASEVCHVLATQAIWQNKYKSMRIDLHGVRPPGVTAKDAILSIIAQIGAAGATGHVIEYAGEAIRAMSVEERMTVCNMSIEAGARAGMVAPDETTFAYLKGRPYAPAGADWDKALALWRSLPTDEGARFDSEFSVDAGTLEPMVTWGTSPQDALPVSGTLPDPAHTANATERARIERSFAYMGLRGGMKLTDIAIDRVFIGSCTNSRIEDLRAAARVAARGKAKVPVLVSPGSSLVKSQAEAEGLDRIFTQAGFDWRESGCSMCAAMNGDLVPPGQRCASTSNRNFPGRQGRDSRTHLMSPELAAAAALNGRITDVRRFMEPG